MSFVRKLERIEIDFTPLDGYPALLTARKDKILDKLVHHPATFELRFRVVGQKIVIEPMGDGYEIVMLGVDSNGIALFVVGQEGGRIEIPWSSDYQISGAEPMAPGSTGL